MTASVELFSQYGFKAITMDDVARRAGISKKTLYQHFANKQEVVYETMMWHNKSLLERCGVLLDEADNAVLAMVKILAFFDNMYRNINPLAIFELQRYFPEAYNKFKELLMDRDVTMVRKNIEQGKQEGLYRAEVNADLMAKYRIETSLLILQPSLMVSDRSSLMSVPLEIGEHFLYGIMTPKGVAHYQEYKTQYIKQVP